MGGMMGAQSASAIPWILLSVALVIAAVAGGVWMLAARSRHRSGGPRQIHADTSPAVQEARDALRLRYARGEIGREDYLQGKVELED